MMKNENIITIHRMLGIIEGGAIAIDNIALKDSILAACETIDDIMNQECGNQ